MALHQLEEEERRLNNQISSLKHRLEDAERAHAQYPHEQDPLNDIAYYEDQINDLETRLSEVEEEIRNGPLPE